VRLIDLKDSRSDGGLLAFRRAFHYVGVAPDLRDISSRKGDIEYVKKEFDGIGAEIFKKWMGDVVWPHIS